jgi:uncharacterized damage-inducible protein DinB
VSTTNQSIDTLRELLQYTEWADATVWRAVMAHEGARTDTRLRDLLVHLHMVQRLFLLVWRDQPIPSEVTAFTAITDLVTLQPRAVAYYPEARAFLDALDAGAMTRPITMPFVAEYEKQLGTTFGVPTLGETIFQVMHHSTYHRGQVNARLREVGAEPPLVDYIAWIWFRRPAAEWSPLVSAAG